jgi:hypothetical protein
LLSQQQYKQSKTFKLQNLRQKQLQITTTTIKKNTKNKNINYIDNESTIMRTIIKLKFIFTTKNDRNSKSKQYLNSITNIKYYSKNNNIHQQHKKTALTA